MSCLLKMTMVCGIITSMDVMMLRTPMMTWLTMVAIQVMVPATMVTTTNMKMSRFMVQDYGA